MANITNEQRSGLIRIIEENGRSKEFFEKYGKPVTEANRKEADVIAKELQTLADEEDKSYTKHRKEEQELQNQQYKERNELDAKYSKLQAALSDKRDEETTARRNKIRSLDKKLKSLGFVKDTDYQDDKHIICAVVDTDSTNAEYSMFKKRALAGVWGAETLESANKAIQKYLDLEK